MSLTSAWSITRRVNPPRAVYTDFPLGHTAGKPHDRALQQAILRGALAAFTEMTEPGTLRALPCQWSDDDSWKNRVMRAPPAATGSSAAARDDRTERHAEPQYQTEEDRRRADAAATCPGCIWLEDRAPLR